MKRKEHEEKSIEMFGKPYTKVHAFLDQHFKTFGPYHRVVLHHALGVNLMVQFFGVGTRQAAEQHIIDDLGFIPANYKHKEFYFDRMYAPTWLQTHEKDGRQDLEQLFNNLYKEL